MKFLPIIILAIFSTTMAPTFGSGGNKRVGTPLSGNVRGITSPFKGPELSKLAWTCAKVMSDLGSGLSIPMLEKWRRIKESNYERPEEAEVTRRTILLNDPTGFEQPFIRVLQLLHVEPSEQDIWIKKLRNSKEHLPDAVTFAVYAQTIFHFGTNPVRLTQEDFDNVEFEVRGFRAVRTFVQSLSIEKKSAAQ